MQKAVIYANRPDNGDKIENQITKLFPLYETAKFRNLTVVKHYFEISGSSDEFLNLIDDLKKDKSITYVIMDNNEIIMNEKIFPELLELKRTVYIVGERITNVIYPDMNA